MNDQTEDRTDAAQAEAEPPVAADTGASKKASSTTGLLALLIALAAAAGSGFVWYELQSQRILEARVDEIGRALDRRATELDRLLENVDELVDVDRAVDADLIALTTRVDRDLIELEGLPDRLARMEAVVEKVPGISQKSRNAWLRSEAEYFLRVANAQLNLASNVDVALKALELADAQLRDLGDPALTPVREAISDERTALRAVPRPDGEGIVLTLGSIAGTLDTLPFAQDAPGSYRAATAEESDAAGWQRAWRAVVEALKSLVSVKRDDQQLEPLLTAGEEALIVRSLDVDLQIARLAVIRSNGAVFQASVDAARQRLQKYFDTDSAAVTAALAALDEVAAASMPDALPDISGSLTLLLAVRGGDAD